MTPMVDLAFLLVAFFMLTTSFAPEEPSQKMTLWLATEPKHALSAENVACPTLSAWPRSVVVSKSTST